MTTLKLFAYQEQFMREPMANGEMCVNVTETCIIIGIIDKDEYGVSLTHEEFNRIALIVERIRVARLVATGEPSKKGPNDDYR